MIKKKRQPDRKITFQYYAPEASRVYIAGTFNNWNPTEKLLKKCEDGIWKISLKLSSGFYEYRFLVDGAWKNDQRPVECVPNVYGSMNCVIEVL